MFVARCERTAGVIVTVETVEVTVVAALEAMSV
jgi:hypothetical protein